VGPPRGVSEGLSSWGILELGRLAQGRSDLEL